MKITVQFPTNSDAELRYAADLVRRAPEGFRVAAMVNGPNAGALMKEHQGIKRLHLYTMPVTPPISMMALRHSLLRICREEFDDDYGIITDGDVTYKDAAFGFLEQTAGMISKPIHDNGFYCSLRGFFGSAGVGDRVLIPLGLPFGTNNGTMVNKSIVDKYLTGPQPPHLPGVCEDQLFTTWFFLVNGAIPLRRFKAPIIHKKKSTEHYERSAIHSREVLMKNNFALVKRMWAEEAAKIGKSGRGTKEWGGTPHNMDEKGKVQADGSVLMPYAPHSDAVVKSILGSSHPLDEHLRPYRNWEEGR